MPYVAIGYYIIDLFKQFRRFHKHVVLTRKYLLAYAAFGEPELTSKVGLAVMKQRWHRLAREKDAVLGRLANVLESVDVSPAFSVAGVDVRDHVVDG